MDHETVEYEYVEKQVTQSVAPLYISGYESFGWILDNNDGMSDSASSWIITFKRKRKIRNKAELTRLQHNFDACVNEVLELEASTHKAADIASYGVGITGSALVIGSISLKFVLKIINLCFAVLGIIDWLIPWFLNKAMVKRKAREIKPLMEQKYNEMRIICGKASALLDFDENRF